MMKLSGGRWIRTCRQALEKVDGIEKLYRKPEAICLGMICTYWNKALDLRTITLSCCQLGIGKSRAGSRVVPMPAVYGAIMLYLRHPEPDLLDALAGHQNRGPQPPQAPRLNIKKCTFLDALLLVNVNACLTIVLAW